MNDQELRGLVREIVRRHLAARGAGPLAAAPAVAPAVSAPVHPSQGMYLTVVNTGDACVIEPAAPCDHCGYCKSHGH